MKNTLCLLLVVMAANPAQAASPTRNDSRLRIPVDYRSGMTASALWRDVSSRIDRKAWLYGPLIAGSLRNDPQCQSADFGREFDAIVLGVLNDIGKARYTDAQQKIALFQQRLRCLTPSGVRVLDSKLATYFDWALQYLSTDRKRAGVRGLFNLGVLVTDELLYTGEALFMGVVNKRHAAVNQIMGDYPFSQLGLFLHDKQDDAGTWHTDEHARKVFELYRDSLNFGLGLCSQLEMLEKGGVCTKGACNPEVSLQGFENLKQWYRFGNPVETIKDKRTEMIGSVCVPRNRGSRDATGTIVRGQNCAMLQVMPSTGEGRLMCISRALDLEPTWTPPTSLGTNPLAVIDRSCTYTDSGETDKPKPEEKKDDKKNDKPKTKEEEEKERKEAAEKKKEDEQKEAKRKADEAAKKTADELRKQAEEARKKGMNTLADQLEKSAKALENGVGGVVVEDDVSAKCGRASACTSTEDGTIYIDSDCLSGKGECKEAGGETVEREYILRHEAAHYGFQNSGVVPWWDHDHNYKNGPGGGGEPEIFDRADAIGGPSSYWKTPNPNDDAAAPCGQASNVAKQIAALYRCNPRAVQLDPWSRTSLVYDPNPEQTATSPQGLAVCFDPELMNRIQNQIGTSLSNCPQIQCAPDAPCICASESASSLRPLLPGYNGPMGAVDPMPDEVRPARCFLPGCR